MKPKHGMFVFRPLERKQGCESGIVRRRLLQHP